MIDILSKYCPCHPASLLMISKVYRQNQPQLWALTLLTVTRCADLASVQQVHTHKPCNQVHFTSLNTKVIPSSIIFTTEDPKPLEYSMERCCWIHDGGAILPPLCRGDLQGKQGFHEEWGTSIPNTRKASRISGIQWHPYTGLGTQYAGTPTKRCTLKQFANRVCTADGDILYKDLYLTFKTLYTAAIEFSSPRNTRPHGHNRIHQDNFTVVIFSISFCI